MSRRRWTATRRRAERGAAAVEMALLTPLLLVLLCGVVDFGRMLYAQVTLTEAGREGARAVALGRDPAPRVASLTSSLGAVTTNAGTACAAGSTGDATVTVTYKYQFITPIIGLAQMIGVAPSSNVTLTGRGVMPCVT